MQSGKLTFVLIILILQAHGLFFFYNGNGQPGKLV